MTTLQRSAQPALERLLQADVRQLYAELGLRQRAIEHDPTQAGYFDMSVAFDARSLRPDSASSDV